MKTQNARKNTKFDGWEKYIGRKSHRKTWMKNTLTKKHKLRWLGNHTEKA